MLKGIASLVIFSSSFQCSWSSVLCICNL